MTTTLIFGNIRLRDLSTFQEATLFSIFARINATATGAALFETSRMNNGGLDVYMTNQGSHGAGSDGLFGIFAFAEIHLNFSDASNVNIMNQFGEIAPLGLARLVVHEFIHAATGLTDISELR